MFGELLSALQRFWQRFKRQNNREDRITPARTLTGTVTQSGVCVHGDNVLERDPELLTHRETCATGDVVAELPLAQSTVSEHLRILREAGLIQGEIEGPRTRYCVNATGLAILKAGINAL